MPESPALTEALAKLRLVSEQQPELGELAATNAALLQTMYAHELPLPHVDLDAAHARYKLEGGVPLLRGETLTFDQAALRRQFERLCRVMTGRGNTFAADLELAARSGRFPVGELADEVITGDPRRVAASAAELNLDAGLAATLLRFTLFPVMVQLAATIKPLLQTEAWRKGFCPLCGSWPSLGEYRGLELTRFLRCGLCATEWPIDRLLCPFCDNRLHQDLVNLVVEGEEQKQRAVTCSRCHGYIKQLSTLVPIPPAQLLVADLATLHLDLAALQRNFEPPR